MKKSFQLFFAAVFVLMSCEQLKEDKTREFIPGVYVKAIDHEFAEGMDTIAISILDKNAGIYVVIKKSGYQQRLTANYFHQNTKHISGLRLMISNLNSCIYHRKGKLIAFYLKKINFSQGAVSIKK